jgi:hypothetical protein
MKKIAQKDDTKYFILNNEPIEEKLHVISVISNPCNYKIRYKLANEFIARMEKEPNIILYLVELVYGDQEFVITSADNKNHLQLKGEIPLWHKENMINLGVKYLLPSDWKAFAWIDMDIEFESTNWVLDTLKLLNNGKDFVQLFSHCIDMSFDEEIINNFNGFGYQFCKNFKKGVGLNYWHPGFAWACNRKSYDKMGGIYQEGILGSGDNTMCHGFIKKAPESLKSGVSQKYIEFVKNLQNKMDGIKLGYIDGTIRHYFHGKKENIHYYERDDILVKYQYDPYSHIELNEQGLIIPSESCPKDFLRDIMEYFKSRNEDEIVLEEITSRNNDKDVLEYKINFVLKEFEKLKRTNGGEEIPSELSRNLDKVLNNFNNKLVTNPITKPVTTPVITPVTKHVTKPVIKQFTNTMTSPAVNTNKSGFGLYNKIFGTNMFNGYSNNGYPNNGYPNNGYPNNGYPNNGYPNNGYPNNGYPNNGYSNNGYPQNKGFVSFKSLNFK